MKLLLLTDCPPCKNLTGGLVLDQLCRFLRRGSVVCFAVTNPDLEMKLTPDLDWIPIAYAPKPSESGDYGPPGTRLPVLRAAAVEGRKRLVDVPRIVDQAVEFGRRHSVDAVLAVLEGQTIVRMAVPVADQLRAPLFTLVWDPLSWWLSAHKVDPWNRRLALREFDRAMRRSEACAVASWAMAEQYEQTYGTRSIPVIASHDAGLAATPPLTPHRASEIVMGMAGQFYASEEWHALVGALNAAQWRVGGRDVRLKVLGHYVPASDVPEGRLDFLGWKSQPEAIKILAHETDVLYCPYPFDPNMEEVSRLSFPSKLPLYFAAGRPVLFHGPEYASPGRYIVERDAGLCCNSAEGSAAVRTLERLASDPELYTRYARNSQRAFKADFTLDTMRANFFSVFGVAENRLTEAAPPAQLTSGRAPVNVAQLPRKIARRVAFTVPKVRDLYQYAQGLRAQRDRLALKVSALHAEAQTIVTERESLRKHIGYLEQSRERLQKRNGAYRGELRGLRRRAELLEAERRLLHAELEESRSAAAEHDALARRLADYDQTFSALLAEKDRHEVTIRELQAKIERLAISPTLGEARDEEHLPPSVVPISPERTRAQAAQAGG